ncbi:hypothetical protein E8E13_009314 [Curvularia kusanoi]|uniref:Uncharacterized protein n=1 Tax=Curvularia kusanoi TaxID=90978 RepID=A0A9P4THX7_CURKU|nr:hypothetical protein E8E13_009314 [Curvularia kusanoi]
MSKILSDVSLSDDVQDINTNTYPTDEEIREALRGKITRPRHQQQPHINTSQQSTVGYGEEAVELDWDEFVDWDKVISVIAVSNTKVRQILLSDGTIVSDIGQLSFHDAYKNDMAYRPDNVVEILGDQSSSTLSNSRLSRDFAEGADQQKEGPPSIDSGDAITFEELHLQNDAMAILTAPANLPEEDMMHTEFHPGRESSEIVHVQGGQDLVHNINADDDRWSVQSLESSTTLVSTTTDKTSVEMTSANWELRKLFQGDKGLVDLYNLAIIKPDIGPDRLKRNLQRLIERLAQDLYVEADCGLERLASQFIAMKGRHIAHDVVEEFCAKDIPFEPQHNGDDANNAKAKLEITRIEDDWHGDLSVLRKFLVESDAFQVFRYRLAAFVVPRPVDLSDIQVFRLHKNSTAQVRHHKYCCTAQICECIPPQSRVIKPPMGSGEYDCNPSGPPDTWPPVCPEFMMHMFHSPACIAADDTSILEQIPKKMDCRLNENGASLPEGWGLYFQEDIDVSGVVAVVFAVLGVASLVFLIVWTVCKDDIQGASGVSAYMVAIASMLGIWIATKSKSFV